MVVDAHSTRKLLMHRNTQTHASDTHTFPHARTRTHLFTYLSLQASVSGQLECLVTIRLGLLHPDHYASSVMLADMWHLPGKNILHTHPSVSSGIDGRLSRKKRKEITNLPREEWWSTCPSGWKHEAWNHWQQTRIGKKKTKQNEHQTNKQTRQTHNNSDKV